MRKSTVKPTASTTSPATNSTVVEPLLRVEDIAELLNVQPSTVYEWVRMDYIPHIRIGVGKKKPLVRFERSAIIRWLEERRREGRLQRVPTNMN